MSESQPQADSVFRTAITIELGLGFVALLLGWMTGVDVRQWLPELRSENVLPILTAIGWGTIAALPMLAVVEIVERIDWQPFRELRALDQMPVVSSLLSLGPAELMTISLAAGVGEELLVRGWLMGLLIGPIDEASWLKIATGVVASAVAFGLMHPVTPAYIVLATLIGIYLGGLVIWTGNLLVAIAAHAVYDAVHLLIARHGFQSKTPESD
jgi:membrane protease YdiL (CAAX protease family)